MSVATRRQREKEERRSVILDAAERVFLGKGLRDATMEEISEAAELSKGTLYLYFDSKDDLFLAIGCRVLRELLARFDAITVREERGARRVEALLSAYAGFAMQHRDRFRVAMSWLFADHPVSGDLALLDEHHQLVGRMARHLVDALVLGQHDGSVRRELDPDRTAFQLWAGTVGMLLAFISADRAGSRLPLQVELADTVPSYLELVLRGLRPVDQEAP